MEIKLNHSKGKWYACCKSSSPHFLFANDGEVSIATFTRKQDDGSIMPIEEMQANAKLIETAPEMLECLLQFMETPCNPDWIFQNKALINKIKNAIKKATE